MLNVAKSREKLIDFWKKRTATQPLSILEEVIEMEDFKYLGVHIDCKLNSKTNTEAVHKKEKDLLSKLRSFSVCNRMLDIFYPSANTLFYAVVCPGATPTE